jgi:hypothetical protein
MANLHVITEHCSVPNFIPELRSANNFFTLVPLEFPILTLCSWCWLRLHVKWYLSFSSWYWWSVYALWWSSYIFNWTFCASLLCHPDCSWHPILVTNTSSRLLSWNVTWHSERVGLGEVPYRFRAWSNILYGRQADILDFVFRTVTAEWVARMISYFCGIVGWIGGGALSI